MEKKRNKTFQVVAVKNFLIKNRNALILTIFLFFSIIGLSISGFKLIKLNKEKFQKEGELREITLFRNQFKDITQGYEELWIELIDKDFEIY